MSKPRAKRTLVDHPGYVEMVKQVIIALKERSGSALPDILKAIETNWPSATPKIVKLTIKRLTKSGVLTLTRNKYKLSKKACKKELGTTGRRGGARPRKRVQPKTQGGNRRGSTKPRRKTTRTRRTVKRTRRTTSTTRRTRKTPEAPEPLAGLKAETRSPLQPVQSPPKRRGPGKKAGGRRVQRKPVKRNAKPVQKQARNVRKKVVRRVSGGQRRAGKPRKISRVARPAFNKRIRKIKRAPK